LSVPFDKLLSPIVVGTHEIRNRVVVTAHSTSEQFRNPPLPAEPYIEYLRRRAAGGVGLIIAQPHFPNPFGEVTEEALRRHRALASAVRSEGATILLQLAHLGLFGRTDVDPRRPGLWAFDDGQSEAGEAAHRMTDEEVERMVDAYRQTAVLAREAGFDGVEVHGAHGYLIQQSLTPRWNHRDDRWGADRTTFATRIIAEARAVFGPDGIVGYRTATDDLRSPEDEGRGVAGIATDLERILGTGQIDLLNTTVGHGGKSYARAIPTYRYEEAPNIPFIAKLRKLVDIQIPVVGVGRIVSPAAAEAVLQSGACDLVAMTRASIADPDLVTKAAAGMGDRIRPCVGASVCVDRKLAGFPDISCFHNPEVLREIELAPRPTSAKRRILVVGAGPAGLKAAEVAARRGHDVFIFDEARTAGGGLRAVEHTAAAALMASVDYLLAELRLTSAELHLSTRVDQQVLAQIAPDEVVLATGAASRTGAELFDGGASGRVVSSAEALTATDISGEVLVHDAVGTNEGVLVAETLARRGCRVTFATRFETIAPFGGQVHRWAVVDILRAKMYQLFPETQVGYVDGDIAILVREDGETVAEVKAPTIVAVAPGVPRLEVRAYLQAAGLPFRIVGDAQAPRTAWNAFTEGHLVGLAV
jgi:2,4-dienoyl-CoA reductase-like NADH-dependent reductase (Old Yellow Enzyme family)